ncbi:MAG: hypothetical protein K9W45_08025 [Candidatus Heimdallarchaeum aukensis]|uniref:Uncharacterized protein n=1 Tax=Candidatus Heimdallarchaeum aukensis TaxID=2876573 RepID=A0A9Y1BIR8_9ARCH|nr:MAG: hypothetical protein K9W45_08025 [Candidatus Heimdallarchaeum aukensis]
MSKNHFVIFAPPTPLFTKNDIYIPFSRLSYIHGTYIKAIADCFFLSNKFRFNNILHYYTLFKNNTYLISFNGKKLRYLGPSYFSASNLLLRALTHIVNPRSNKGKLTPGLTVEKIEEETLNHFQKRYKGKDIFLISNRTQAQKSDIDNQLTHEAVFLFGYQKKEKNWKEIFLGNIEIDEQMILLNYYLDLCKLC